MSWVWVFFNIWSLLQSYIHIEKFVKIKRVGERKIRVRDFDYLNLLAYYMNIFMD